jgi:hypothetical protein
MLCVGFAFAEAQTDTTKLLNRIPADTSSQLLNMDAGYNRPFLTAGKFPVAIGGYLEANSQFSQTNGVNEGLSFQVRRLTLFFSSTIAKKIKFLSELEFEDGGREINVEIAALDLEFDPLLTLRGGIIVNPIGAFNQNHDGPKWDFVDRPIASTTIIPSTFSNAGFGIFGKHFINSWALGYEAYLTNGLDDRIILNNVNKTWIPAGKSNPEKFEESYSGVPAFTGKLAIRNRKYGELGISYFTSVYNKWQDDGITLDSKRSAQIAALDFNTALFNNKISITGEVCKAFIDIPETYSQQFGTEQWGGFLDVVVTVLQKRMLGWDKAKLNLGIRAEYADYNQGEFAETGGNISDDIWAIVPAIAFRPAGATVLRFNYRYDEQQDLLGNPPAKTGTFQFGFATYF